MITKMTMKSAKTVFIISIIFMSGCEHSNNAIYGQKYEDINVRKAYSQIQDNKENKNFIILDVRTPEEYASGHLGNAVNSNYNSPAFRDSLASLDKNKTYLVYCRTGNRSSKAVELMKILDFTKVYNMNGGIVEWLNNELPIIQ
ncbi:rhodanese-like domain-containing protein [Candidatus Latescibacterota bacterium]